MSETTSVKAKLIKAKSRPDLVIPYGPEGEPVEYTLSGRIPSEIMTVQANFKAPKNAPKDVQEQYQRELGVALIDKFYDLVVPDAFKKELDMEDLPEVFEAWSEHVGLGESKDSGK